MKEFIVVIRHVGKIYRFQSKKRGLSLIKAINESLGHSEWDFLDDTLPQHIFTV